MIKVKQSTGKEICTLNAEKGEKLYSVLTRNNIALTAPCGGRGKCGKCRVKASGNIKTDENGTCLACKAIVEGDCEITLMNASSVVLTGGARKEFEVDGLDGVGMAVDIGTTTMAAYLMDLKTGKELARASMLNPQRLHGADVISRLEFANANKENPALLSKQIIDALNELKTKLLTEAQIDDETITACMLVGNTVMMHLAAEYDSSGLAKAPFKPYYNELHTKKFAETETTFGGCISGYVGADTVSAMLACDMDKLEKTVLMIDIGTNGEIALKHDNKFYCCSCAAGPAFEGAHIACGTGAIKGAIDHLYSDSKGYAVSTIGGGEPCGICGSGLIDITAYLLGEEEISLSGRMKNRFVINESTYVEPQDIREIQLAKAAIAAGIEILRQHAKIEYSAIDTVFLAGGFGNYINIASACAIGLLPPELENKIICVGNAAGDGAKMQLLSKSAQQRAETLRKETEYIELSTEEDFEDIFAEKLLFEED